MMKLAALHVYPLKSARGMTVGAAAVEARGLAGDRRWMLVDGAGGFLSQRTRPKLALVDAWLDEGALAAAAPGMPPLAPVRVKGARIRVRVWGDTVDAALAPSSAHAWFSRFLGIECRLVSLAEDSVRPVDPNFGAPGDIVSFADGFPLLVTAEASLAALNRRLPGPVPMDRFRPNLIVTGSPPYDEDHWRRIRVGEVAFRVVKPCSRCVITTIDQATGERGREPLATLARERDRGSGPIFGQNLVPDGGGVVRVGDPVEILERGS